MVRVRHVEPQTTRQIEKTGHWLVIARFANDDGFKHSAATAVLFCGNLAQKKEESPIRGKEED